MLALSKHNMKRTKICIYVFLLLLVPLNPLLYTSLPVSAAVVWSDDFDDGNYDGWTIKGLYAPYGEEWTYYPDGEAEIVNNELRFTAQQIFRNATFTVHESSVAYGNWSIDVKVRPIYNSSNHTHITFIDPRPVEDVPKYDATDSGYDLFIYSAPWTIEVPEPWQPADDMAPAFLLRKHGGGGLILGSYSVDEINGTYHIEITRDETGRFKVYINGTLRIEAVNTLWRTSQSFHVNSESGIGYDNVIVRDDVIPTDETTTTSDPSTTPPGEIPGELLVILIVAPVAIVIVLVVFAKRRK